MVDVQIRHRDNANVTLFFKDKQINIKNHVATVDLETAEELVKSPFGYEFASHALPFNPDTWTKTHKSLTWNHIMPYYEGYGYVAQMMIYGLKQLGVDVSIFYKPEMNYLKREIMDVVFKPRQYDTWGIWHHFWMKPNILPMQKKAMYTMWESTQLNEGWRQACNEVNMVLVPCEQNKQTFLENGVTVPIEVVQHGVDQEFYFYRPKENTNKFRFGTFGSLVPRKDPELLIKAFLDEFGENTDVELYIKDTNEDTEIFNKYKDNKNIIFNGQKISPIELGDLISTFDTAVFTSHGEGFGLGGLQAMGVGTTCICTDWGGFKEYLNPEYNYALESKLINIERVYSNNTTYSGQWAQGNYEHLRSLMRYSFEHRDEMREKGKKASEWVKNEWAWTRPAQQLINAIDKYEKIST